MKESCAVDQLGKAIDALGLDRELGALMKAGLESMSESKAERLLSELELSTQQITQILKTVDEAPAPTADLAGVPGQLPEQQATEEDEPTHKDAPPQPHPVESQTPVNPWVTACQFAVDLGASNTMIYATGAGIVRCEPSVVACSMEAGRTHFDRVMGFGARAMEILAHNTGRVVAVWPTRGPNVDVKMAAAVFRHACSDFVSSRYAKATKPLVVICVPGNWTRSDWNAMREVAYGLGANNVFLIEEPMAAAIGAGLAVSDVPGSMVVDIGGGRTDVGFISRGQLVFKTSSRVGGDQLDTAIVDYVRRHHGMLIGERTAEDIKKQIGCAFPGSAVKVMQVSGRNLTQGNDKEFSVSSTEVLEALHKPLDQIVSSIRNAVDRVTGDFRNELVEHGITLTGGGALLQGVDRLVAQGTGLYVQVANDPSTCAVRGSGIALEHMEKLSSVFMSE